MSVGDEGEGMLPDGGRGGGERGDPAVVRARPGGGVVYVVLGVGCFEGTGKVFG